MRSVKAIRSDYRTGRASTARRGGRAGKASSRSTFGRRKRNDPVALSIARVRSWFAHGRPMLWLTLALLALTLVGGVLAGGYVRRATHDVDSTIDTVAADAGFAVSSIQLSGNHRTQPAEILPAIAIAPGQSIFSADLQEARRRLKALPWVFDAEVRRQYPDHIFVNLIEREPFALWQSDRGLFVVDRSGHVILPAQPEHFPHLPLLAGNGAPRIAVAIVDAVAAHRATNARVKVFQRVSDRRWNLILDGGVVVELPEDNWERQLDVLERLIVDKGVLERDISEIDLRLPDRYIFLLHNGRQQQSTRGNAA